MKHRNLFIASLLLGATLSCTLMGCQGNSSKPADEQAQKKDSIRKVERHMDGMRLTALIKEDKYQEGLKLIDTMRVKYPQDAQVPFIEGWMLDHLGESEQAKASFSKSLEIYDSLCAEKYDFGNEVNRAYVILALKGDEAFQEKMDFLLSKSKNNADSALVNMYRQIKYDKDALKDMLCK